MANLAENWKWFWNPEWAWRIDGTYTKIVTFDGKECIRLGKSEAYRNYVAQWGWLTGMNELNSRGTPPGSGPNSGGLKPGDHVKFSAYIWTEDSTIGDNNNAKMNDSGCQLFMDAYGAGGRITELGGVNGAVYGGRLRVPWGSKKWVKLAMDVIVKNEYPCDTWYNPNCTPVPTQFANIIETNGYSPDSENVWTEENAAAYLYGTELYINEEPVPVGDVLPKVREINLTNQQNGETWKWRNGVWDHLPIRVEKGNTVTVEGIIQNTGPGTGTVYGSIRVADGTVVTEKTATLSQYQDLIVGAQAAISTGISLMVYTFPPPNSALADSVSFTIESTTPPPPQDCAVPNDCLIKYGPANTGFHWECINNECTQIQDEPPPVDCSTAWDCQTKYGSPNTGFHWECINNVCQQVGNPPVDCNTVSDCVNKYGQPSENHHWECQNNVCVEVEDHPPTYIARSIGPFGVPAAMLRLLWRAREKYIRKEVHKKLHPVV